MVAVDRALLRERAVDGAELAAEQRRLARVLAPQQRRLARVLLLHLPLAERGLLRRASRGEAAAHGEQRARVRAELVQLRVRPGVLGLIERSLQLLRNGVRRRLALATKKRRSVQRLLPPRALEQ